MRLHARKLDVQKEANIGGSSGQPLYTSKHFPVQPCLRHFAGRLSLDVTDGDSRRAAVGGRRRAAAQARIRRGTRHRPHPPAAVGDAHARPGSQHDERPAEAAAATPEPNLSASRVQDTLGKVSPEQVNALMLALAGWRQDKMIPVPVTLGGSRFDILYLLSKWPPRQTAGDDARGTSVLKRNSPRVKSAVSRLSRLAPAQTVFTPVEGRGPVP
jgi:hypothetical protein